jgi:hypothetical protein
VLAAKGREKRLVEIALRRDHAGAKDLSTYSERALAPKELSAYLPRSPEFSLGSRGWRLDDGESGRTRDHR